MKISLEV